MIRHILLAGLLLTWAGCGKPSPSESGSPESRRTATASDQAELTAALAELTQVVRRFAAEQRKAPKSLDELVAAGYLSQVPEAPPGKKFAISRKLEVYLTKQ